MFWKKKQTARQILQSLDDTAKRQLIEYRYQLLVFQVREAGLHMESRVADKAHDIERVNTLRLKYQSLLQEVNVLRRDIKAFSKQHKLDPKFMQQNDSCWDYIGL